MAKFSLIPHAPIQGLLVHGELGLKEAKASLRFSIEGDWNRLELAEANTTHAFVEGLWEHSCFELFVGKAGSPEYVEWNISPSGDWWHCAFSGYRKPFPSTKPLPPVVRYELNRSWSIVIDLQLFGPGPWQFSPCVILKEKDNTRSFWALSHAANHPDFHDRKSFLLTL